MVLVTREADVSVLRLPAQRVGRGVVGIPAVTDTLEHFLAPTFEESRFHDTHPTESAELLGLVAGGLLSIAGIGLAWFVYLRRRSIRLELRERLDAVHSFLVNKWYFDELFDYAFTRPVAALGTFGRRVIETDFVQGVIVGGATGLVRTGSSAARAIQTGYLRAYAFLLLVGMAGLALYFLIASS